MDKMGKKTCGHTGNAENCSVAELQLWAKDMHKHADMARKAANAADLMLALWWEMTDEQRERMKKNDSFNYSLRQLVGHGYSWL